MSFEISYDLTKSLYMACLGEMFFSNTFHILFFRISNSTQILSIFFFNFVLGFINHPKHNFKKQIFSVFVIFQKNHTSKQVIYVLSR
jgi:hypothetical protein